MENQALLFIPDISGFTQFVTATEIEHSNHIIASLIEEIIAANGLGLVVSEIEGDAVLFYRLGAPPAVGEVVEQAKTMFRRFHSKLSAMESCGRCHCGACSTASNLTVKFVTHYGQCREMPVHTFTKLIGSDVILAHRLLKNALPEREYLLLSEQYLNAGPDRPTAGEGCSDLKPFVEQVADFGEVRLRYLPLASLRRAAGAPA